MRVFSGFQLCHLLKYLMRIGESGRGQAGSENLRICVTASGTEHLNITVLMATRNYNFRVLFG